MPVRVILNVEMTQLQNETNSQLKQKICILCDLNVLKYEYQYTNVHTYVGVHKRGRQ